MTLQNTDGLVVQRENEGLYSVEIQNVMAKLNDTDLLVVCRDETAYKITGEELKGSFDPDEPPIIETTTLTENNPDVAPRFTEQTFNVQVNMEQDGDPQSQKTIDAYVEGTFVTEYLTDPITAVTDTPTNYTPINFNNTTGPCRSIATDGNGHWIAIVTDSTTQLPGYYLGTGNTPTFNDAGSPAAAPSMFNNIYGVCGSTNGRFIMTGIANTGPQGIQIVIAYSDDYGASWVQSNFNSLPARTDLNQTTSLHISTDNSGKWFIGTSDASSSATYSLISTDNGATWTSTTLPPQNTGGNVLSAGMSGDNLIIGGNNWYYSSTDGGTTWSQQNTSLGWGFQCVAGSGHGTTLCSRATGGSQVARFVNGVYVQTIDMPSTSISSLVSVGGITWLAAGYSNVYESTDDGVTWNLIGPLGVYNANLSNSIYTNNVYVTIGSNLNTSINQAAYCYRTLAATTLAVSGENNLSYIPNGTSVNNNLDSNDPDYAFGLVNEVVIDGANSSVKLGGVSGTWQIDQIIKTEPLAVESSKLYLDFDSNGNVQSLSDTKPSPAYVSLQSPVNLTLTFPAEFPTGLSPDEELPEGTTLNVEVEATNRAGSSSGFASILPVVVPFKPVQPEASGVYITTLTNGLASSTIACNTTSPIIAGPWSTNTGVGIYAVSKLGELVNISYDGVETITAPSYDPSIVSQNIISGAATYDGQHMIITETGNIYYYSRTGSYQCSAASLANSLEGADIYGWTYFKGLSGTALGWSNANKKVYRQSTQSAPSTICGISHSPGSLIDIDDVTDSMSAVTFDLNPGVDIRQIVTPGYPQSNQITSLLVLFDDNKLFYVNSSAVGSEIILSQYNASAPVDATWKQISASAPSTTGSQTILLDSTNTSYFISETNLANGSGGAIQMPGNWVYCPLGNSSTIDVMVGINSLGLCFIGRNDQNLMPQNLPAVDPISYKSLDLFLMNSTKWDTLRVEFPIFPPLVTMTTEEYSALALKFATYKNREMVQCGRDAEAKRDGLILELEAAGYNLNDILSHL